MPRNRRPLDREGGRVRDASLIVIASEDTYAVKHYLAKFLTKRVQFIVLPTAGGRSSPAAVLERLDQYQRQYEIGEGDEFWVCIDLDHWAQDNHISNLLLVQQRCRQKQGYRLAISHPCFDLWILLHFQDPPSGGFRDCEDVAKVLRGIIPGYDKKSIEQLPISVEQVEQAIERAKGLPDGESLAPSGPTTQMHLILESLRAKEAIRLTLTEGRP